MQYINEKWLRLFNYYYFFYALALLGLYIFFAIQQRAVFPVGREMYGINAVTGIFTLACVLYNLLFFSIVKNRNLWLAYALSFTFYAIACSATVEASLEYSTSLFFLAQNFFIAPIATSLGSLAALFVVGADGVVFAMTVAGNTDPTLLGVLGDGVYVSLRLLTVMLLIYLLRNKYFTVGTSKNNYIERHFVNNEIVKLLTESISDGVFIIDQEENIKAVNSNAIKMLGQEEKDIIDLNYRSVLHFLSLNQEKLKPEEEPVDMAFKNKSSVSNEYILTVKDKQLYVDTDVSVLIDPVTKDLYGTVVMLRDFSKKKQEDDAKTEFISTASHEMRTPVAAIEGYLALALNDKVSKIDDKARGFLQKAHDSTKHLGKLFQDLLASSKAEDGRLVNEPIVIEMGQYLADITDSMKFTAESKGLGIEFVIGTQATNIDARGSGTVKPLYFIYADANRIREAITNLFDNAVKYTETGKIVVGLTGDQKVVQIRIQDTGIGITPEDIPHLFQKFYRVDSSATRTIGGTGLGLYLCRMIVEMYNGRLWVESELGKGSTFYINLPRLDSTKAYELQRQQTQTATSPGLPGTGSDT